MEKVTLDNKTIAKLSMAIAYAISLKDEAKPIDLAARMMLQYLDEIDVDPDFVNHEGDE